MIIRRDSGFTLIELLVVVAIIAVLMSVLLPSLSAARKSARQVLCVTNLQSQGKAALLYGQDNRDVMVRGIVDANKLKTDYCVTVLPGLAVDSVKQTVLNESNGMAKLIAAVRKVPQLQCPTHPDPKSPLDYVASAFPVPQTQANINLDINGGGQANPDSGWQGEYPQDYVNFFRLASLDRVGQSRLIWVSEGHISLPKDELRFHHMFYTSQLPFGAYPRIANDRRHPGGLANLFFDGHAQVLPLNSIDSGWPNTLGHRLRWFTEVPAPYQ